MTPRFPTFWLGALSLGLALAASVPAASGPIRPGSAGPEPSRSAAANSFAPAFSADGRHLVFVSQAKNLLPNQSSNPYLDIFTLDRQSGALGLASVNRAGASGGDGNSSWPSGSSNGQWIAFASDASDLAGTDTNEVSDIFVRDLAAQTTVLVSVDLAGARSGDGPSAAPRISADGRWVVFESKARNLVTNAAAGTLPATGPAANVFARDLWSNTTVLVSVSADGLSTGVTLQGQAAVSGAPALTPDGRFVAFCSTAANLVTQEAPPASEIWARVYVRDLRDGITRLASPAQEGASTYYDSHNQCSQPALSADGRRVVFKAAGEAASALVLLHDLQTTQTAVLSTNTAATTAPQLSANGRWAAFEDSTNILLWDALTASNTLVNVNTDGSPILPGPARMPVLTPDGQFIAFLAAATPPLGASGAAFQPFQVYVRDVQAGVTRLVSAATNGAPCALGCQPGVPALAADGQCAAFESPDGQLVAGDANRASDVFLRDLASGLTQLVSQRHPDRPAQTGNSMCLTGPGCLSADGRWLAFTSLDTTLAASDTNGPQDVLVRDLAAGTNTVLSQGLGAPLLYWWSRPVVSANGRYAAFLRRNNPHGNLSYFDSVSGDPYRSDLQTGLSEPAGLKWDNSGPVAVAAPSVSLSPDGRLVAFRALQNANSLNSDNRAAAENVYIRDMARGTNFLISTNQPDPLYLYAHPGTDWASPLFSPDGRWLAFLSPVPAPGQANDASAAFFYTADLGTNTSASDYLAGVPLRALSLPPVSTNWTPSAARVPGMAFSGNSRYLISWKGNGLSRADLSDPAAPELWLAADTGLPPSSAPGVVSSAAISADGRFVAWCHASSTYPARFFLADLARGVTQTILVPVSAQGRGVNAAQGTSVDPIKDLVVSADGSYVLFTAQYPSATRQLVLFDRLQQALLVLSSTPAGAPGGQLSQSPVLGADGRTVVFQSFANDLAAGDYNDHRDIFLLQLGAGDSDADGLDDDWEMAWFSTLARDGAADFDADGMTDAQEFRAGTNPLSADPSVPNSVLRVLAVRPAGGGAPVLFWAAAPGRTYRVQYKDQANGSTWRTLEIEPSVNGATASLTDSTAGESARRFYRVTLAP